jgi:hypothetical protein
MLLQEFIFVIISLNKTIDADHFEHPSHLIVLRNDIDRTVIFLYIAEAMNENAYARAIKVYRPFEIEDKMMVPTFNRVIDFLIQFFRVRLRIDISDDMDHLESSLVFNFVFHKHVLSTSPRCEMDYNYPLLHYLRQ